MVLPPFRDRSQGRQPQRHPHQHTSISTMTEGMCASFEKKLLIVQNKTVQYVNGEVGTFPLGQCH
jgi:hypothetical protein